MGTRFDHGRPQVYFSSGFIKNHLFLGSAGEKKRAERVFDRRGRAISTVLCLTRAELVRLAGELHRRQHEFTQTPRRTFTTLQAYDYWSRGGPRSKDKQRATPGKSRFRYSVQHNTDGTYVMCHFDGPS